MYAVNVNIKEGVAIDKDSSFNEDVNIPRPSFNQVTTFTQKSQQEFSENSRRLSVGQGLALAASKCCTKIAPTLGLPLKMQGEVSSVARRRGF
ncbi:MAG: hypothetical protein MJ078_08225, partial [Clostridia bacterium]|nr:hypothetical protein [Clostridia bacterium]